MVEVPKIKPDDFALPDPKKATAGDIIRLIEKAVHQGQFSSGVQLPTPVEMADWLVKKCMGDEPPRDVFDHAVSQCARKIKEAYDVSPVVLYQDGHWVVSNPWSVTTGSSLITHSA